MNKLMIFTFFLAICCCQLYANHKPNYLQSLLKEDEVLVSYRLIYEKAYADITTKDTITHVELGNTDTIKLLINGFLKNYISPQKKCVLRNDILLNEKLRRRFLHFSNQLYQKLWQPIEKTNSFVEKTFLVIPSRELFYIPFELLVKDKDLKSYQEYQYLIKQTNLIYYPNSAIFIKSRIQVVSNISPLNTFLGVFISDFSQHKDMQFNSLNSINEEIGAITSHLDKDTYFILKEEAATEEAFKTLNFSSFSCLHLSTHAVISDRPDKNGYIVLNPSENEDGLLYFGELMDLNDLKMDLELLSFSFCGPAREVSTKNSISFLRFLRSIMINGSPKSIIPSLWEVYDKSTANFFIKYYKNLHEDKYQPLRKAKLEMIASEKYANPYYWAPFVFMGER